MPRRTVLSSSDRATPLAPPNNDADRIRLYTFSDTDLALIGQRRGGANRIGFAVRRVIDRVCSQAIRRANRILHRRLTRDLDDEHRTRLDALLAIRPGGPVTVVFAQTAEKVQ